MLESEFFLGGVAPSHICWQEGEECEYMPVPGGRTNALLVRTGNTSAPLLVLVHHFPAERCERCGTEIFDGPQSAEFTRMLEVRYQQGELPPAEMDFISPVAA